jgi:GntR family transcriptional regulator / MocR family aminotransferase
MVKRAANVDVPALELCRKSRTTLPRQLAEQFRTAICCGRLPTGSRLPASRSLARAIGVSRNTVLEAYDHLIADGLVDGHVGAGSYVIAGIRRLCFEDPEGNPLFMQRCDWRGALGHDSSS